ncbi:hypothetical protein CIT31_16555 [Mesorhizobium wenxiniae]|uniref:Uncharacterized protein n=1 Tax=Mesorhizobium wenxiniae TaxID=2014805 RepID=A0A271KFP2_9HYPH|nr:hypothetical protein CIT31_16555 [Mesorhizobium wenxiniae]
MVKILTLTLLLAIAGCQSTKGSFCAISSPIRISASAIDALTDAEVKALLAHNRKGQKLCGWRP